MARGCGSGIVALTPLASDPPTQKRKRPDRRVKTAPTTTTTTTTVVSSSAWSVRSRRATVGACLVTAWLFILHGYYLYVSQVLNGARVRGLPPFPPAPNRRNHDNDSVRPGTNSNSTTTNNHTTTVQKRQQILPLCEPNWHGLVLHHHPMRHGRPICRCHASWQNNPLVVVVADERNTALPAVVETLRVLSVVQRTRDSFS
jgi:hypothetical protein